jgi:hypothetical protein
MTPGRAVVVAFDFQLVGGADGRHRDKFRPFSALAYRRPRVSPFTRVIGSRDWRSARTLLQARLDGGFGEPAEQIGNDLLCVPPTLSGRARGEIGHGGSEQG